MTTTEIDPNETTALDEAANDASLPKPLRELAKARRVQHFDMWTEVQRLDRSLGGGELHRVFEGPREAWATSAMKALDLVRAERGMQPPALNEEPRDVEPNPASKAETAAALALATSTDEMRGRVQALRLVLDALQKK
jgi:hypothetical protein